MTDEQLEKRRKRNCAKCHLRKSQEKFMNWYFDYHTCPFMCNANKTYNGYDILKGCRFTNETGR